MLIPGPVPSVTVHLRAYLGAPEQFELRAAGNPAVGFTRTELVIGISQMYQYVYRVEEETRGMEEAPRVSSNSLIRGFTFGKVSSIAEPP